MRPLVFALACGAAVGCGGPGTAGPESWTEPITGMVFVRIEAGRFVMGTPELEFGREPQETPHRVTLSRPFFMARHEVTQGQWRRIMGTSPSRARACGEDCPVEGVSLLDVEEFLGRLRQLGGAALRLPTEAEWEYACRAGSSLPFSGRATLDAGEANVDASVPYPGAAPGPVPTGPVPVGSYAPNAWGLHDFHGNVWEWTLDEYCPYAGEVVDPRPECGSELRVIRGGSWLFGPDSARCGLRYTHRPQDSGPSLGFRLVRELPG